MKSGIFLLLGTNQGDRSKQLLMASKLIGEHVGKILRLSSIYKTAAWGNIHQPEFYNQVIEIETSLSPSLLLEEILSIEKSMGRKRLEKWGPRVIDIDILFFGDQTINYALLKVPHPGIAHRRFTLIPLAEIAPELEHPILKKNMRVLLQECADTLPVEPVT